MFDTNPYPIFSQIINTQCNPIHGVKHLHFYHIIYICKKDVYGIDVAQKNMMDIKYTGTIFQKLSVQKRVCQHLQPTKYVAHIENQSLRFEVSYLFFHFPGEDLWGKAFDWPVLACSLWKTARQQILQLNLLFPKNTSIKFLLQPFLILTFERVYSNCK